jgi:hypothetical protein
MAPMPARFALESGARANEISLVAACQLKADGHAGVAETAGERRRRMPGQIETTTTIRTNARMMNIPERRKKWTIYLASKASEFLIGRTRRVVTSEVENRRRC